MTYSLFRLPLLALLAGLALPIHAQQQNGYGAQPSVPVAPNGKAAPSTWGGNGATSVSPPQVVLPNGTAAPDVAPKNIDPSASAPPAPTLSDLGRSLRNYFTEDELGLLFQYMQESVIASFKGEEVNLPPDLSFKLEILLVRLKKESGHYMDNLIQQLEQDLKRGLKEKLTPPPIKEQPYNPWFPMQ
ncbi:MAG: hypothetical protein B7Y41_07185 [Hydrogenophilales bacterium 28-61-23]|nr:MAG: hypothetical protein B7Y41_07185 [Hydrogenophilales bacterium 28-61-23]